MTAKSDRARRLLDDPELQEAFVTMREHYRDAIEMVPLNDPELLMDARKMLHLLRELEDTLKRAIQDGTLEDFRAQEQEKQGYLQDVLKWPKKT